MFSKFLLVSIILCFFYQTSSITNLNLNRDQFTASRYGPKNFLAAEMKLKYYHVCMAVKNATCLDYLKDGWGGIEGKPFVDNSTKPIKAIRVRCSRYIDSIQLQYAGVWGTPHGGTDGVLHTIELDKDEWIVGVEGRSGLYVDKLIFITNKDRVLGGCGGTGGHYFSETAPEGMKLIGISGKSDKYINRINFIWG